MRYNPDYRGTQRDVLHSTGIKALVNERAELGAEAARAEASSFRRTGRYQSSIETHGRSRIGDRYGVILTATVPYAQRVEQRHHTIASVVDIIEHG